MKSKPIHREKPCRVVRGAFLAFLLAPLLPLPGIAQTTPPSACAPQNPINTLGQLSVALMPCWVRPAGAEDMDVTLRFALRRDGSVIASPKVIYRTADADRVVMQALVVSAFEAVEKAVPIKISDQLGEIIAGQPLTVSFRKEGITVELPQGSSMRMSTY